MNDKFKKVRITEKGRAVYEELLKYPERDRPRILHEMLHDDCRGKDPCKHDEKILDADLID